MINVEINNIIEMTVNLRYITIISAGENSIKSTVCSIEPSWPSHPSPSLDVKVIIYRKRSG